MVKIKDIKQADLSLSIPPFIYINDPTDGSQFASKLGQLIPAVTQIQLKDVPREWRPFKPGTHWDNVVLITDKQPDHKEPQKRQTANIFRDAAIKSGCNFASINLFSQQGTKENKWGTNHMNMLIGESPWTTETSLVEDCAKKIYQWLFTVLTVKDTLYLIPDEQMKQIDPDSAVEGFEYCAVADSRKMPKDAKIQFVALVLTKPAVMSGQRLFWKVADKTGVAMFYFKWRGLESQETWDWVLSLEPGQRKCLPRMPSVLMKENLLATIVKAPVRVPASVLVGTGLVIAALGIGMCKVGKSAMMGRRKKWIPAADVATYLEKHTNVRIVPNKEKITIQVFTDKGEKTWEDSDSGHSTVCGECKKGDLTKQDSDCGFGAAWKGYRKDAIL